MTRAPQSLSPSHDRAVRRERTNLALAIAFIGAGCAISLKWFGFAVEVVFIGRVVYDISVARARRKLAGASRIRRHSTAV